MADTLLVASDESLKQNPNLDLSQLVYAYEYHLGAGAVAKAEELKGKIMTSIVEDNMLPYYQFLSSKFSWVIDETLASNMRFFFINSVSVLVPLLRTICFAPRAENEKSVQALDAKYDDAVENQGDMEVPPPSTY